MNEPIRIVIAGDAAPFQKKTASWTAKDGRFGTHAYDSKKYSGWKDQARYAASQVMGDRPPLACQVRFELEVYRQIPAAVSKKRQALMRAYLLRPCVTPDWDNLAKAAGDAMIGIVIRDDKFIVSGHVEKWYSDRPRVEIIVTPIEVPADSDFREVNEPEQPPLFKRLEV